MTKAVLYQLTKGLRQAAEQVADGSTDGDAERVAWSACYLVAKLAEDCHHGDADDIRKTLEKGLKAIADELDLDTGPSWH